jgi:hypothetical protein
MEGYIHDDEIIYGESIISQQRPVIAIDQLDVLI